MSKHREETMIRVPRVTLSVALLLSTVVVLAQELPSVDTDTARTQIEQFQLENEQLADEIAATRDLIESTRGNLARWKEWIEAIEKVSTKLAQSANKLLEVESQIANKSVLQSAQDVLDRYGRLKLLLETKAKDLNESIADGEKTVTEGAEAIESLTNRIARNASNIELLTAAMAKSRTSEGALGTLIDDLRAVLDEAQGLLDRE